MFWNDPSLYGATFPFKEYGMPPMPFQGNYYPRPFYGTLPWIQNPSVTPFIQPWLQAPVTPFFQPYLNPFAQTQPFTPFFQPHLNPFAQAQAFPPFFQPYNLNLPLHNVVRPSI